MERLCHGCRRSLGNHWRGFTDDFNGLEYRYHFPTCWESVKKKVVKEYCWAIYKAQQKEVPLLNATVRRWK